MGKVTRVVEISPSSVRFVKAELDRNPDVVDKTVGVLNGIVHHCHMGGFTDGFRNEVILNLTVSSYLLGLKPEDVLDWFVSAKLIRLADDDEDTYERVERAERYRYKFSYDYMINPDLFYNISIECSQEDMPIVFRVV